MIDELFSNGLLVVSVLGILFSIALKIHIYLDKRHKHNHPVNQ